METSKAQILITNLITMTCRCLLCARLFPIAGVLMHLVNFIVLTLIKHIMTKMQSHEITGWKCTSVRRGRMHLKSCKVCRALPAQTTLENSKALHCLVCPLYVQASIAKWTLVSSFITCSKNEHVTPQLHGWKYLSVLLFLRIDYDGRMSIKTKHLLLRNGWVFFMYRKWILNRAPNTMATTM